MLVFREFLVRGWFKETGFWWGAVSRQMVVENNFRGQSRAFLFRFKVRRFAGDVDRSERDFRSGGVIR
ncbi:hypothetical protein DF186_13980 [Enterococcus hirae]|nr:hypothetical protein DF186_13980 [Enterococcus hirae]